MSERTSGYYWIRYRGDEGCLYYNQNSKRLIYGAYKLHESDVEFISETPITPDSETLAKVSVLNEIEHYMLQDCLRNKPNIGTPDDYVIRAWQSSNFRLIIQDKIQELKNSLK